MPYNRNDLAVAPLSTSALATRPSGSTLLACVGRGVVSTHSPPSDNKGNPFTQVGTPHVYTLFSGSGTALYASLRATGGAPHVVSAAKPLPLDEATLSVVEIVDGGAITDFKWNEVLAGGSITSLPVTTTGPALIVAWWWGDGGTGGVHTAIPDNGFTVIDSVPVGGSIVQCVAAVRQVNAAGTYQVTWTSTPVQGAQMWIAAVQYAV